MKIILGFAASCLIMAGCSTAFVDSDTEARAAQHMALADSLEEARAFDEAIIEYQIVAQHYPSSSAYPGSVRQTALLYMNPENPMCNDSLALHWVSMYLALPVSWPDRENARAQLHLLERVTALQHDIIRRQHATDSLLAVERKQDALLSNQAQQLQVLQNELKQVRQELDKLKQVDVQINKSRRK